MPAKSTFPQDEIMAIQEEINRSNEIKDMETHIPKYTLITSKNLLRNDCGGDYYETPDGDWTVVAVQMKNPHHSELILIHEVIETMLIRAAGIPEPVIDAFDAYFEILRQHSLVGPDDEPGDHPAAPYHKQHKAATAAEKIVCEEGFDLSWDEYEEAYIRLIEKKRKKQTHKEV